MRASRVPGHVIAAAVTETELIQRCRLADPDAQRELYDQTAARIYRVLLRMTRDPQTAFDLAQDTYLKAFAAIDSFDGHAAIATWLYRIAVNEALQHLRRRRVATLGPALATDLPDPRHDGQQAELRLDLEDALAALEPEDRAILLLRYQEGLDYRTIADVTGVAVGTVGSRLNRARSRLREHLAPKEPAVEQAGPVEETTAIRHPKQEGVRASDTGPVETAYDAHPPSVRRKR